MEVVEHNFKKNSVPEAQEVSYRVVQEDEIKLMAPMFERLGWPLPDPNFAKIVVQEIGQGKDALIVGFNVVQFITHAEPMWINPSMRGLGLAEALADATMNYIENDCHIKRYVATAKPGSFAARICEQRGMVKAPVDLYVKQLP